VVSIYNLNDKVVLFPHCSELRLHLHVLYPPPQTLDGGYKSCFF
jgi:hypothetical protein